MLIKIIVSLSKIHVYENHANMYTKTTPADKFKYYLNIIFVLNGECHEALEKIEERSINWKGI